VLESCFSKYEICFWGTLAVFDSCGYDPCEADLSVHRLVFACSCMSHNYLGVLYIIALSGGPLLRLSALAIDCAMVCRTPVCHICFEEVLGVSLAYEVKRVQR